MDTTQDPNLGNGVTHNGHMIPYRHTHRPTLSKQWSLPLEMILECVTLTVKTVYHCVCIVALLVSRWK